VLTVFVCIFMFALPLDCFTDLYIYGCCLFGLFYKFVYLWLLFVWTVLQICIFMVAVCLGCFTNFYIYGCCLFGLFYKFVYLWLLFVWAVLQICIFMIAVCLDCFTNFVHKTFLKLVISHGIE
jgi:hypothetical protein